MYLNVLIQIKSSTKRFKFTHNHITLICYHKVQNVQSYTVPDWCTYTVRIPDNHCIHIIPKQSLYQHDVCYRDVIKCPGVQATTPPGISTHPLTPAILTLGCHIGFAWKGVELRRCVFNGYLSHGPQRASGSLPFQNLLSNLPIIPSRIHGESFFLHIFYWHAFRNTNVIDQKRQTFEF